MKALIILDVQNGSCTGGIVGTGRYVGSGMLICCLSPFGVWKVLKRK
jgi:hypothetical protein